SYVEIADDYGMHKLNSAYGRAKVVTTRELQAAGERDQKLIHRKSNQAGAKLLIQTIEELTGRTIDNYASINLLGFHEITQALGGVEVCLKEATQDVKSGADFPAGRQTISGLEALAFVRQRNGLPRGDLDRVVRQQVFMAGLARKTISAGTLTDAGKLSELSAALKKSVVLNQGWDVIDFARQMSGLSGGQVQFSTIPVGGDLETADGDALQVDPAQVQEFIAGLSGSVQNDKPSNDEPDPANAQISVDVMNGTGITGLAAQVLEKLGSLGFTAGTTGDVPAQDITTIKHAPGEQAAGQQVADSLPGSAQLAEDQAIPPGKVMVLIGADFPQDGGGHTGGGGSQPQGGEQSESQQPEDEKPITADGVRCVY
ncbi:MAG: LCP family protein, partial [Thermocrispum sp.]